MKKPKKGMGRPRISDQKRDEVAQLYQSTDGQQSLRSIALELGLAAGTVGRILREAGLLSPPAKKKADPDPVGHGEEDHRRPSLRAVAAKAGVSLSTVSLALRESPRVAAETRKQVRTIAQEMNYEVHPYIGAQLAAVRRGRVHKLKANLAYLYSGFAKGRRTWRESLEFPSGPKRYFDAARAATRERGYNLEPVPYLEEGRSMQRLEQILKGRGMRGLILDAPSYIVTDHPFDFRDYATVAVREQNALSTHVFGHDNFLNILRSVCQLWRLGYRRIGYIGSDALSLSSLFAREAAMRHAQYHLIPEALQLPILHLDHNLEALFKYIQDGERMAERNRPNAYDWVFEQDWRQFIEHATGELPDRSEVRSGILKRWMNECAPEVIVCEDFSMMSWLKDLGYSVPSDIGLVHNNINFDVADWSGVKRADESIGIAAAENLCNAVELGQVGPPSVPIRQLLPGEWVEGKTTRMIDKPLSPYTTQADRFIKRVLGEVIEPSI